MTSDDGAVPYTFLSAPTAVSMPLGSRGVASCMQANRALLGQIAISISSSEGSLETSPVAFFLNGINGADLRLAWVAGGYTRCALP